MLSLSLSALHVVCARQGEKSRGTGGKRKKKRVGRVTQKRKCEREEEMSWMWSSVFVFCLRVVQFPSVIPQFFWDITGRGSVGATATINPAGRRCPRTQLETLVSCGEAAFFHLVATYAHTLTFMQYTQLTELFDRLEINIMNQ